MSFNDGGGGGGGYNSNGEVEHNPSTNNRTGGNAVKTH
jgi:hypothetical protein